MLFIIDSFRTTPRSFTFLKVRKFSTLAFIVWLAVNVSFLLMIYPLWLVSHLNVWKNDHSVWLQNVLISKMLLVVKRPVLRYVKAYLYVGQRRVKVWVFFFKIEKIPLWLQVCQLGLMLPSFWFISHVIKAVALNSTCRSMQTRSNLLRKSRLVQPVKLHGRCLPALI